MEIRNPHATGGSLQISSDVIAKIANLATSEIEGVAAVETGSTAAKNPLSKLSPQKPINVQFNDEVADIEVSVVVNYGVKIPELCEKVQKNVKSSVQNMTSITVAKVNVVIAGVAESGPVA